MKKGASNLSQWISLFGLQVYIPSLKWHMFSTLLAVKFYFLVISITDVKLTVSVVIETLEVVGEAKKEKPFIFPFYE